METETIARPTTTVTVSTADFAAALKAVSLAASTDKFRPQLMGVNVEFFAEGVRLFATNSYWLAFASVGPVPETDVKPAESDNAIIFDYKRLDAWFKATGALMVTIEKRADGVAFTSGDSTTLSARDGDYSPVDWRNLWKEPAGETDAIAINPTFLAAIAKIPAILGDKKAPVRFTFAGSSLKPAKFSVIMNQRQVDGLVMPVRVD